MPRSRGAGNQVSRVDSGFIRAIFCALVLAALYPASSTPAAKTLLAATVKSADLLTKTFGSGFPRPPADDCEDWTIAKPFS